MKADQTQLGHAAQEDANSKGEEKWNLHGKLKRAVKSS